MNLRADITLTNGFWSTDLDECANGTTNNGYRCDGVNVEDDYNISGTYSQIRTVSTDASGGPGKVFSVYFEGNSRNSMSAPATINFPSPQKEFWLRFYYRLPVGQRISSLFEHKIIYAYTDGGIAADVNWPGQGDNITLQPRSTMAGSDLYYGTDGGWADVYGSSSAAADGSWHCFEFHFVLGTSRSNNGKFEMWVDGNNHVSVSNLDWFNGGSASPSGWTHIDIPLNHNVFTLSGAVPHDVDNIAVALPSYSGFAVDSGNRRMIGTTGSVPDSNENPRVDIAQPQDLRITSNSSEPLGTNPTTAQILFQEKFDDGNLGSRGWYDNTSLEITTQEHLSGSAGSVEFHFLQGAQNPTSGAAMRRKFAETDEVYISYYIKHSANWVGSNRSYHPHIFFLMTNLENDYWGPSVSHLTAYVEENDGYPIMLIQDTMNIDQDRTGQNLINITETRATGGCNGTTNDGNNVVDCYGTSGNYRNEKKWTTSSRYFRDDAGSYYKGDWHHVEAYFKLNTIIEGKGAADGILQYWFDGVLIMDYQNAILRTAQYPNMKFNQFLIAPYIGDGSPVNQTFWVDSLTVGKLIK